MSSILIIDTSIWAYYFDRDSPEHKSVVEPVEKALKSEQIAINTTIIMELGHFLIKNLGPVEGGERLGLFLRFPLVISDFEYRSALDSLEMLKRYSHLGVGGRDATILALMSRAGVKKIMTHDEALKKVDWLEAFDPVAGE
ncbi:MAG: type II toxin-antitoxin system VapC family toxin [archaeon]|nr:MAG: type II toxin-antitoxin system VapC family toxin [archaeon]